MVQKNGDQHRVNGTKELDGAGMEAPHDVLILDSDNLKVRDLVRSVMSDSCRVRTYSNPKDLLAAGSSGLPSCLLLGDDPDNGLRSLDVFGELRRQNWNLPTVFLATDWSLRFVVNTMRKGFDGFLPKPLDPADLHEALTHALNRACNEHRNGLSVVEARARVATLNAREKDVVRLVINGMLNKEVAHEMGLALVTVKLYRSRAMSKLGAGNAAEMVHIAGIGGLNLNLKESH